MISEATSRFSESGRCSNVFKSSWLAVLISVNILCSTRRHYQIKAQSGMTGRNRRIIWSMLNAGVLTFQEFVMHEPLPLATIHGAVLEFLRGRDDVVVFGATAVNAYVSEPRMTQDIDLMSMHAPEFAEELRLYLAERFHIAIRVRVIAKGRGYRLFQMQRGGKRHL